MKRNIDTILREVMSKYINESETGSGRVKNPNEEQEYRYDKLDMWNAYFREHPFCIWVYATPSSKTRIPVDVMLRANFDASFDPKQFVSLRCTLYDAPENYRKNLRWKEVEKANDFLYRPLRDRRQPFNDDIGPQEVLNKWVMEADDKYYCLIAPNATSQEEKAQLISQEIDRYQKELYGSVPESKNRERMISLSESQIIDMVNESLIKVLNEEKSKKKVGNYIALDGQWWDGLPHGLEHKGLVQDVRMYDKPHKDGIIDTIGLFRRCDNRKFFYARIIPIKDSKETKWKQIKRTDVPQKILDDFVTINSQGHEPYPVL